METASQKVRAGSCLCKGVQFEGRLKDNHVEACHCSMCRKWSAGPVIATPLDFNSVKFKSDSSLAWYKSSEWAERGFCSVCGTNLFYRLQDPEAKLLICMIGALDDDSGLHMERHICVDGKPNYYDFADDTPRLTSEELFAESS